MKACLTVLFFAGLAGPAWADLSGDVIFLGEQHDNPAHHQRQAEWVERIGPTALVFEMLTDVQADQVTPSVRRDMAKLEATLDWEAGGWPDFDWYYPIFAAAPAAAVYGANVPREVARDVMGSALAEVFGPDAVTYGLTEDLPEDEQEQREALQLAAHCDALPAEMLPVMVQIQRLRDASLARAALRAYRETGGPVVVITGNGHARTDWGAPFLLHRAAPDLVIAALGQSEIGSGPPEGLFDVIAWSEPVQRDDPCEAFLQQRGN
ncbi:ChaN family lipoprotein [Tropicibacter sp. S64]|uniref:ChaN family lipoprotein n=1 Tax=Tropicibacter sp. S64 TaxID=3415122 RepID=UPI003C7A3B3B